MDVAAAIETTIKSEAARKRAQTGFARGGLPPSSTAGTRTGLSADGASASSAASPSGSSPAPSGGAASGEDRLLRLLAVGDLERVRLDGRLRVAVPLFPLGRLALVLRGPRVVLLLERRELLVEIALDLIELLGEARPDLLRALLGLLRLLRRRSLLRLVLVLGRSLPRRPRGGRRRLVLPRLVGGVVAARNVLALVVRPHRVSSTSGTSARLSGSLPTKSTIARR
jgi:hypothetical protein